MTRSYSIKKTGGAEVLKLSKNKLPELQPNEVTVKNQYVAISHMDIHHRNGTYTISELPQTIGISGSGTITKVGSPTSEFKVGEKVIYGTNFIGSYSEEVNINQHHLVTVPDDLPQDLATAAYLPGLTAHYLIYRTFKMTKDSIIVVNGAAGSVGHILCQWLSNIGIDVIGVVGSDSHISAAKNYGCKYVINHKSEDYVKRVMEISKNKGANVIYDCYGHDFFKKNTDALGFLGLLVNYGDVTGKIKNFDVVNIWNKSLFYTKPSLSLYKINRMELVLSAAELFNNIKDKNIRPVFQTVPFSDMARAHQMIENREITGSLIAKL